MEKTKINTTQKTEEFCVRFLQAFANNSQKAYKEICKEALRSIVEHYEGDSMLDKVGNFQHKANGFGQNEDLLCIKDTAKDLNISVIDFSRYLVDCDYAHRSEITGRLIANKEWVDKGYFVVKPHSGSQPLTTKKGRDFFKSEI